MASSTRISGGRMPVDSTETENKSFFKHLKDEHNG
jgi:hypothetical protein